MPSQSGSSRDSLDDSFVVQCRQLVLIPEIETSQIHDRNFIALHSRFLKLLLIFVQNEMRDMIHDSDFRD